MFHRNEDEWRGVARHGYFLLRGGWGAHSRYSGFHVRGQPPAPRARSTRTWGLTSGPVAAQSENPVAAPAGEHCEDEPHDSDGKRDAE